jgi:hypothetical protein
MKIYSLLLILLIASCSRKTSVIEFPPNSPNYTFNQEDLTLGIAPTDSLTFEYDFIYGNSTNFESETVSCVLKNESSKPFYFQTWSCFGWVTNFNYDTMKFQVYPSILCNISRPIIKKISANSEFRFVSHFQRKDSTTELTDLSYFVYPVSPDFDTHDLDKVNKLEKVVVKIKGN